MLQGSMRLSWIHYLEKGVELLNADTRPLYLPSMTWVDMDRISSNSIIFVLSSDSYNITSSIRSLDEYLSMISM